jgi:hypothetical protein
MSIPKPEGGGTRNPCGKGVLEGEFGMVVIAANTLWGDDYVMELPRRSKCSEATN